MSFTLFLFYLHAPVTTNIYTLFLHDALPISIAPVSFVLAAAAHLADKIRGADPSHLHLEFCRQDEGGSGPHREFRSEEHTSELQSHSDLVCRLLLEKKKNKKI